MNIFTRSKYIGTLLGFKIRAHRIIIQLAAIVALIYFYDWLAFALLVVAFAVETVHVTKVDLLLNPWLKAEVRRVDQVEFEGLVEDHFTDPRLRACQLIRQLDGEAYSLMGKIHQITIDLIERAEIDLANESNNIERDELTALRYEVDNLLEVMDESHTDDVVLLTRLSRALNIWDNDAYWKDRYRQSFEG